MSISTQIVVIMTIMTIMTIISIPDSGVNCGDLLCPLLCRALHQDLLLLLHQEHQVSHQHQISSHHQLIMIVTNSLHQQLWRLEGHGRLADIPFKLCERSQVPLTLHQAALIPSNLHWQVFIFKSLTEILTCKCLPKSENVQRVAKCFHCQPLSFPLCRPIQPLLRCPAQSNI